MKKTKRLGMALLSAFLLTGCNEVLNTSTGDARTDTKNTMEIGDRMADNQSTPTDLEYSLERYNLIRRAYWVNGQREKAQQVTAPIADIPLAYVVLLTESGTVISSHIVEGKVTSLNSFLTPDSEYYESNGGEFRNKNNWLPDVDGSYGENDNGIFFFTPDGKYIEFSGTYLYSDAPFLIESQVLEEAE